jgi:hypothetical protein
LGRPSWILCGLLWAVSASSSQTGQSDALSAEDDALVRLVVELSWTERAGWAPDGAVLLDSTLQTCDGAVTSNCLDPHLLDDLASPGAISLMTPECARVDYRGLRNAFVAGNRRTLRLRESEPRFPMAPASEVRTMSAGEKDDRFGARWFVEVSAPAYSADRRYALVHVQAAPAFDGFWGSIRIFERRDARWAPTRCGLNVTR